MASIFIISAPSGAGKTSLVNALTDKTEDLVSVTSYTTRTQRLGEVDGTDYHFVKDEVFLRDIAAHQFMEHACVFGSHYGTAKASVYDRLNAGLDVLLEIDWQGAKQVRDCHDQVVSIFILPPSIEVLEARLRSRKKDSESVILERTSYANVELSQCGDYDYIVVNDVFDDALCDLMAIVQATRLSVSNMQSVCHQYLDFSEK